MNKPVFVRVAEALTELLHAADLINPPDPVVYEHIGDTYKSLGNTALALTYWQKGLTLDPQSQSLATKIDQAKAKVTANPPTTPPPMLSSPTPSQR